MPQPDPFEAEWKAIAAWDWHRIERAVAQAGIAFLHPVQRRQGSGLHPARLTPEDNPPGTPAPLAPEDLRSAVKVDVADEHPTPLSADDVERELYHAAALYEQCRQRGLRMGAEQGPDGQIWVCVRQGER